MAKTKPTKSDRYHHGNLRESLVEVALKFLENHPVEDLSLRKLATLAGVSQTAPYRHFKDRDAVLAAISHQGFELKYNYMVEEFVKNKTKPIELLHGMAQAYFKMAIQHSSHFRLMVASHVCPDPKYPELMMAAAKTYALMKASIEICQKAKVVGPGDPYHHAMQCWALVNGFATLFVQGRISWLGVTEKNASATLRTYIEQYRLGASAALPKAKGAFTPFQSAETRENGVRLKAAEAVERIKYNVE